MATSNNILCGICEGQHITKYADQWCSECDEGLCSDCENHHKISKSSSHHGVITIENHHKLPSSISKISNHCQYHDIKYIIFCQFHDKQCCPDCISQNHKIALGFCQSVKLFKHPKH